MKIKNKNIYLLLIIQFISSFYMVNVIQTLFFQRRGISLFEIGIILASYQLTKVMLEIPTGIISDKYGRKISTFIGLVLFEVFLLICLFSNNFKVFIIAAIIEGISYTFISGTVESFFVDTIISCGEKENLSKYNAINRTLFFLALGLSSLIGGIIAYKSYDLVYILTIIIQLIPIMLLLMVPEPKIDIEIKNNNNNNNRVNIQLVGKYLFKNKILIYFLLIDIFISISMIPIDSYYSNYLKSIGINEFIIGIIICVQYILSSFTGILSDKLAKKIHAKNIIQIFPCIMIFSFLIFSLAKLNILIILTYLFGLVIFSLFAPQKFKYLHENMSSKYRATILSIQSIFMALISSIIQPIYGYLSQIIGMNKSFFILLILSLFFLITNNLVFKKFFINFFNSEKLIKK